MLIPDSELIERLIVKEKLLELLQLAANSSEKKPELIAELRWRLQNDTAFLLPPCRRF